VISTEKKIAVAVVGHSYLDERLEPLPYTRPKDSLLVTI
jgi:hypothetical protein